MKVMLVCVLVGVVGLVKGESDYYLRGPKPTTLIHYGFKPISTPSGAPTQLFESHHVSRPKSKIESYIFGGNPSPPPPPTKHHFHHQKVAEIPSLNALPREPKDPFEVVAAPVIYHRTVTDTDVTKALAAAFEAVDLKKPRYKTSEESVTTTVEFVNHPYSLDSPKASLMTTVVDPQQMTLMQPLRNPGGFTFVPGTVAITSMLPPVPSAADLPPPQQAQIVQVQPIQHAPVTISTAPPAVEAPVQVAPATSTSTVPATVLSQAPPPATAPPPKIIIPNQPHVTTLENINRGSVLIQPIFIPYAVDQTGQPVGPLPDYQAMDFGAIISAQKQLFSSPSSVASQPGFIQQIMNSHPMQFHREVHPFQAQAQEQQQFYYIPNQNIAASAPPAGTGSVTNEDGTSSRSAIIRTRTGKRFRSTSQSL